MKKLLILTVISLFAYVAKAQVFDYQIKGWQLQVDTTYTSGDLPQEKGNLYWNDADGTVDLNMGKVTQQIGQELPLKAYNNTGSIIPEGTPVYISGRHGHLPEITPARSDAESTSCIFGITTTTFGTTGDLKEGFVTILGYVRQIKTNYSGSGNWGTTWVENDKLYVSKTVAGQLTNIEPSAPHHSDVVATVSIVGAAGTGSILVLNQKHVTLQELTDVNGTQLDSTGQIPVWNNTTKVFDFTSNVNSFAGGYTLPIASGSTLGGIKVGSGLSIDGGGILTATAGSGTVTSFSASGISGLFTTSVATATTTPALSFALVSKNANRVFASPDGVSGVPVFRQIEVNDLQANGTSPSYLKTYFGDGRWDVPYTLPTASGSVLGGIKIGSGLSIDGSGVLSSTSGTNYWTYGSGLLYPNTYSTDKVLIGTNSDVGSYLFQVSGKSYLSENSSGITLTALQTSTGSAIYGSATSGKGVYGNATSGRGLYGYAESGTPAELTSFSTSNNTYKDILIINKSLSSGSAATNNGASILFNVYDGSSAATECARLIASYTNVTSGNQESKAIIQTRTGGGSLSNVFESSNKGFGYPSGTGGTVTQLTSKTTGVTLNTLSGQITTFSAALAAAAEATFTVTNSNVAANDVIIVNHKSGGTNGAYLVSVTSVSAGSFSITYSNVSSASKTESPVFSFVIIKGA